MLTLFELWSFKTPKYHFKWFIESDPDTELFTSILTVKNGQNTEIYRDHRNGCGFVPAGIDGTPNQGLPFYAMVREAIQHLRGAN